MLTAIYVRNQLRYDLETGEFHWRESGKGRKIGRRAGCVRSKAGQKWRKIVVNGVEFTSGKLAWLYVTGLSPDFIVDHLDGNSLNDAWGNLRDGSECVTQRNQSLNARNISGLPGVRWIAKSERFKVTIGDGSAYGARYLGWTTDLFEACCLRKRAELELEYGPAHGARN